MSRRMGKFATDADMHLSAHGLRPRTTSSIWRVPTPRCSAAMTTARRDRRSAGRRMRSGALRMAGWPRRWPCVGVAAALLIYAGGLLWPFTIQVPTWVANEAVWTSAGTLRFDEARLGGLAGIAEVAGDEPRPQLVSCLVAGSHLQSAAGRACAPVHACSRHLRPERRDRPGRRRSRRAPARTLPRFPGPGHRMPEATADP